MTCFKWKIMRKDIYPSKTYYLAIHSIFFSKLLLKVIEFVAYELFNSFFCSQEIAKILLIDFRLLPVSHRPQNPLAQSSNTPSGAT